VSNKSLYLGYIAVGVLYVAVKVAYVLAGYLHPGAIAHGAIPAVITTIVGTLALRESVAVTQKRIWHTLAVVSPLLVLVITPLYMFIKHDGSMAWLAGGRLSVLIIYECLAIVQLVAAVAGGRDPSPEKPSNSRSARCLPKETS